MTNSQEPQDTAKRSLYPGLQHTEVIANFLAFSKENLHRGRSVPSWSRYSSDTSSQYLKSESEIAVEIRTSYKTTKKEANIVYRCVNIEIQLICYFIILFINIKSKLCYGVNTF